MYFLKAWHLGRAVHKHFCRYHSEFNETISAVNPDCSYSAIVF